MVGLIGLEPMTPALSRRCSNQLSYRPISAGEPIFRDTHLMGWTQFVLVEVRRLELLTSSLQS